MHKVLFRCNVSTTFEFFGGKMKLVTRYSLAVALMAVSVALAASPGTALASSNSHQTTISPAVGPVIDVYEIVNKTSSSGTVHYSDRLTYCQVGTSGSSCSITSQQSATRSVSVDLGWSRSGVAAGLSISSATTVSLAVTCASPSLLAGQIFAAYPTGTTFNYRIHHYGTYVNSVYSPYLTAFNPDGGIYCRVE